MEPCYKASASQDDQAPAQELGRGEGEYRDVCQSAAKGEGKESSSKDRQRNPGKLAKFGPQEP